MSLLGPTNHLLCPSSLSATSWRPPESWEDQDILASSRKGL